MQEIATASGISLHKVAYWMHKYGIRSRSRSDAIYQKNNPQGDPFYIKVPTTLAETELLGLGLGLYWGEGTKASRHSVRLGNTDPKLLKIFLRFLLEICCVRKDKIRFALQIFSDIDIEKAKQFWIDELDIAPEQFMKKAVVTPSGSLGTYRKKSQYGVLTVLFHNKHLRDQLVQLLEERGGMKVADS